MCGVSKKTAREKALSLLSLVGLDHRFNHCPARLSGGEQQRVAIARALANDPALLIADEPTGNLDEQTGDTVLRLLKVLTQEKKLAVLMATHNTALAHNMDRILHLHEGHCVSKQ